MSAAARVEKAERGSKYEGTTAVVHGRTVWTGRVNLGSADTLMIPARWRAPKTIFVDSMSDLFHPAVPDEFIDVVFGVMALTRRHTFIILTKRPERMRAYSEGLARRGVGEIIAAAYISCPPLAKIMPLNCFRATELAYAGVPLPNVWLGVSVEDQLRALQRIPHLLATPAARRLISAEPLLGELDLSLWLRESVPQSTYWHSNGLDWVIVGGESGLNGRPMNPAWARTLRDQCSAAGVAFFFKQHGEWVDISQIGASGWRLTEKRGAEVWGRIYPKRGGYTPLPMFEGREFETRFPFSCDGDPGPVIIRAGKKTAGALLDGVAHTQTPPRVR